MTVSQGVSPFVNHQVFSQIANEDRALSGRRLTWNGAVIKDLTQGGGYYLVQSSVYNEQTGNWWIYAPHYLGPTQPQGAKVYRYTGRTWDMPAVASTVFPVAEASLLFLVGIAAIIFVVPQMEGTWLAWGIPSPITLAMGFLAFGWWLQALFLWFYRVEPVRGTKWLLVFAVIAVIFAAFVHSHDDEVHDPFPNGPPSPYYQ